jgi:hypothetical protein
MHKKPKRSVATPSVNVNPWLEAMKGVVKADVVPEGWLRFSQVMEEIGLRQSQVKILLRLMEEEGRVLVKKFRIYDRGERLFPVTHYKLAK